MTFDEAAAFALTLDGAERGTSYRQPAVKVAGRTILSIGHEPATSFVLHVGLKLKHMLMEAYPETFWETPHYSGYGSMLVRYEAPDDASVREAIERAHALAATAGSPRRRKTQRG